MRATLLTLSFLLARIVSASLSGSVGPLTTVRQKAAVRTCNILNYGAKADNITDIGPAISLAFKACRLGGVVYVPPGHYAMSTFQILSNGAAWAFQHDGIITRTGGRTNSSGENMIFVKHSQDFEYFSSTGKGAFQGLGYEYHIHDDWMGPRLLRFENVSDFSVHHIAMADAPSFHFVCATCRNGEIYRIAIRGADHGDTDGVDVSGTNVHVHHVTVTNRDECITVKSPAHSMLIENIHCNWSGGSGIGSMGSDTIITDITYRNVYTRGGNQMMLIKSNGGSGLVSRVTFENFVGQGSAYAFSINQGWKNRVPGGGVQLENLTVKNWIGNIRTENGLARPSINILCDDAVPCKGIDIVNFAVCPQSDKTTSWTCKSAYGTGSCLKDSSMANLDSASYPELIQNRTCTSRPSDAKLETDLASNEWGTTKFIPIPKIPDVYFPDISFTN